MRKLKFLQVWSENRIKRRLRKQAAETVARVFGVVEVDNINRIIIVRNGFIIDPALKLTCWYENLVIRNHYIFSIKTS